MKYIVDIKGEIEGDYEIIGKYEEKPLGEWLKNANELYKCSLCGAYGNPIYFRFCPNCGAYMRGTDNG